MEGTYGIPITKSTFLRDYWIKSDGVLAEMHTIRFICITLKHIQISYNFKVIAAESPFIIFILDNLYIWT